MLRILMKKNIISVSMKVNMYLSFVMLTEIFTQKRASHYSTLIDC